MEIQRTFAVLEHLKQINFANQEYLSVVGPLPYPQAYVISQGGFSPYHLAHSELIDLGRREIACKHYVEMRVSLAADSERDQVRKTAQLECNPDKLMGILGFSTDFDVMLKGQEHQHLTIGERIRVIEEVLKKEDKKWIVHDASNLFGVDVDSEPRDSSQFAENSKS